MEEQADYVAAAVPTSFTPTVRTMLSSIFPFMFCPDTVDLRREKKILFCTIAASGNPI